MRNYLLAAYAALSLIALFLYAVDKGRAKRKKWRIAESVLLSVGFFGGAVGALLGMNLFRHKTKHWYCWAINFMGLAWQITAVILFT